MPTVPGGLFRSAARATAVAAGIGVLVSATASVAVAWEPDFEAPFGCGQQWQAGTRSGHSPSYYSVDFNRDDDYRAPVLMSAAGRVTDVVDLGTSSYGRYVVVDHGGGWTSLFAHLDAQWVVEGQWLDQGQFVGLLGTSGGSTGPHLHFEERLNRTDQHAVFHGDRLDYNSTVTSRNCGDVPLTGDWNADDRTDVGVFRPRSGGGTFLLRRPGGAIRDVALGRALDRPLTGDWDGDGRTDLGVWRRETRTFVLRSGPNDRTSIKFGGFRDQPLTGDWDGNGRTDVGVFRPETGTVLLRGSGGHVNRINFGTAGTVPVTGDWNGDNRTDLGSFNVQKATWALRTTGSGQRSTRTFGPAGSRPVSGDWNGDGVDSLGTWNPATAVFSQRTRGEPTAVRFGTKRR